MTHASKFGESSNPSTNIAIIGEAMVEISGYEPELERATIRYSGDTLNTAVYLARLTNPAKVKISYLTGLGKDSFSSHMVNFIRSEGLDASKIEFNDDKLPGMYTISVDERGERSFEYWRRDSAAASLSADAVNIDALKEYDVVYLSGITLAVLEPEARTSLIEACRAVRNSGRYVVFDSNFRGTLWHDLSTAKDCYERMLTATVLALPTLDDFSELLPGANAAELIAWLSKLGVAETCLKQGTRPPIVWADGHQEQIACKFVDDPKDTTAAGDSFSAGYIASRLRGASPLDSAVRGHEVASFVVQHNGAIVSKSEWNRSSFVELVDKSLSE